MFSLAYNTMPWSLQPNIDSAEDVDAELAEQPRYRTEAMTDEVQVIDTLAESAFNLLVHVSGLDPDSDLYAQLWEETCIVASYQADGDPMGDMMGRNK